MLSQPKCTHQPRFSKTRLAVSPSKPKSTSAPSCTRQRAAHAASTHGTEVQQRSRKPSCACGAQAPTRRAHLGVPLCLANLGHFGRFRAWSRVHLCERTGLRRPEEDSRRPLSKPTKRATLRRAHAHTFRPALVHFDARRRNRNPAIARGGTSVCLNTVCPGKVNAANPKQYAPFVPLGVPAIVAALKARHRRPTHRIAVQT